MSKKICLLSVLICFYSLSTFSQKKSNPIAPAAKVETKEFINSGLFGELGFRSVGPALTSGRISDLAVNPLNTSEYYVAAASGGVWKTTNSGISFNPIFDGEGSYSIGCLAIDPKNPNVVWVGTGENNNQRSVAYGDGIYKSEDGGKSWKNMGLKQSEHIGRISIDPSNSDIVYVAAYGPLWTNGGERGIYKTTDGGANWKQVLKISDYTGCNEVFVDPRFPNIVYAAAHQRQRKVYSYIGGGPESALYKSTDGGSNWNKIMSGMPGGDIGRIGLNYSPVNPDVLFAVVEAADGEGGVYKSKDRGASWEKQGGYSTSGNYYQKIYCDPKDINKVFVINTYFGVSKDGGKNFAILGEKSKHIDNHVIWIDPSNTDHYLVGCDGGLYESFNSGEDWAYKANLPVTQFYKVSTDNAFPFYNIHGGTQDNFSIGGPSRTTSINGIVNSDWFFTSTGDGFETQIDPLDPNIIYAQSQYGGLVRYDKKNGEFVDIKPIEKNVVAAYRWNWDAPLLISKYNNKRLYFAANRLFRTNDQGHSWTTLSPDLSRNIDRNKLMVMDRVWSVDAIAKNGSTDIYGNCTSIAENQFDENILYVGTDDGLVQITNDGGKSWNKIDNIPGIPERSYVHQIVASQHDRNTLFVIFNHHRYGDFHPYLVKSTDGGVSWKAIQANLPERGSLYCMAEDHINKNLLFAGTEFGAFCSIDGGAKWIALKSGLPTIAVRDLEIQKRENDLVLGTFGRGFYVLDDYSPLRFIKKEDSAQIAKIYPIKDSWMFVPSVPLGVRGKGFQGEGFYTAPNPKVGAVFSYYLRDDIKTIKEKRREQEKEKIKNKEAIYYPSADSLRLEDEQPAPHILFTISDASGNVVRKLKAAAKKGLHRIVWDYRYAPFGPIDLSSFDESFVFNAQETGYMAIPGMYRVAISKFEDGVYTDLGLNENFKIQALNQSSLPAADKKAVDDFCKKVAELRRVTGATDAYRSELQEKLKYMKRAVIDAPALPTAVSKTIAEIESRMNAANLQLNGNGSLARREFETLPSINGRIGTIVGGLWSTTVAPSETYLQSYQIALTQFNAVYKEIKSIDEAMTQLEQKLEMHSVPFTPGRLPEWKTN